MMRALLLVIAVILSTATSAAICRAAATPEEAWQSLDAVLAQIKPPSFADHDESIVDHGAQPATLGDDDLAQPDAPDARPAIAKAIAACRDAGGGRVVVPEGDWFVKGPIHLASGVNLHIAKDARLLFSPVPEDYLPLVLTRFEGVELMNFSPPIYAIDCENVAITGEGTIDGQASTANWWKWKQTGAKSNAKLNAMSEAGEPVEKRVFGSGEQIRVNFVQPYRCKNVLIEGITIRRSPMWVVHPVLCENVTVRGVTVDSHGPNNDGCNPESCKNVLIENCLFDAGDDCIAIKSGRNRDGRWLATPSENIVVRGCRMKDGHGGVTLGSEMSGGIKNVYVEDCEMDSPQLERAIRLKSNSMRGGYLENLYVRNVRVGQVSDAVVQLDMRYADEVGEHLPEVRNIFMDRVTAKKSKRPLFLLGIKERPIENVVISNSTFSGAAKPSVIEDVAELRLINYAEPE